MRGCGTETEGHYGVGGVRSRAGNAKADDPTTGAIELETALFDTHSKSVCGGYSLHSCLLVTTPHPGLAEDIRLALSGDLLIEYRCGRIHFVGIDPWRMDSNHDHISS
ncbi:hypothetical protein MDOR_35310 [Mycolicibacterium doricum]|uniref:Uncharacterized protein n=1 Tax=Mycolicibacterium doricum TaxID=126673 RepID=A0A7I7VXJ3_9MYCO|nr:hypothetical protein MDOR_35310 [Mycolicibacterium doricum]